MNDYAGRRMTLTGGAVEHCDHCTNEITKAYIRVEADSDSFDDKTIFIYCLECGEEEN